MCGRFTQIQSREVWLSMLDGRGARHRPDEQPIGRYNVAPGSNVLLLNHRDDALHLDPVFWGYGPARWHKAPLINARVETAAESKCFVRSGSMAARWSWRTAGMNGSARAIKAALLYLSAPASAAVFRGDRSCALCARAGERGVCDCHCRQRSRYGRSARSASADAGSRCGRRMARSRHLA